MKKAAVVIGLYLLKFFKYLVFVFFDLAVADSFIDLNNFGRYFRFELFFYDLSDGRDAFEYRSSSSEVLGLEDFFFSFFLFILDFQSKRKVFYSLFDSIVFKKKKPSQKKCNKLIGSFDFETFFKVSLSFNENSFFFP